LTYLCFDQGLERVGLAGVNVIYMPYNIGKIKRLIRFFSFLVRLSFIEKFDILFTIQFKFCFVIGLFARAEVKILDYRTGDLSANTFRRWLNNVFIRGDALFFRHISVISEGLRDILVLSKAKTHILPLGADVISNQTHSFDRIDLLYVGAFNSRNIHQTIEGVALFLYDNKELSSKVSYNIIGFGKAHDEDKLTKIIEKLGLNDTVHFIGRKRYTDLKPFFDSSNIGVTYVPITSYFEHQPVTKLFEYMLSGMAVIATNTYENRLIINSTNGVLINDSPEAFCNGLKSIYNQRNLYNSSEIRESVETHTWDKIVNTKLKPYLLGLLESTINFR
jgi:glycosyltransferase involved in cell wall biosynthesis